MPRKQPIPSAVEIIFAQTADGLLLDRIVLRPANADAERDLRCFLQRFADPEVDLQLFVRGEAGQ